MTKSPIIAQLGEQVLRSKAEPINRIKDNKISSLIDSLVTTAIEHKGVGIAAPQISQSYRLFVIASHPSDRYPYAPIMKPTAIINPHVLEYGQEIVKDWEGCLSVPNVRGLVPRSNLIKVEYTTRQGKVIQTIFTGFIARIFQHEFDHLNGILFIDRVEDQADLYTESEYRAIITN